MTIIYIYSDIAILEFCTGTKTENLMNKTSNDPQQMIDFTEQQVAKHSRFWDYYHSGGKEALRASGLVLRKSASGEWVVRIKTRKAKQQR